MEGERVGRLRKWDSRRQYLRSQLGEGGTGDFVRDVDHTGNEIFKTSVVVRRHGYQLRIRELKAAHADKEIPGSQRRQELDQANEGLRLCDEEVARYKKELVEVEGQIAKLQNDRTLIDA